MSERKDFHHLLCEVNGVKISVRTNGAALMFEELIIEGPGEFMRWRVLDDPDNEPLGWRAQDMEKPAITKEERDANTEALIAQWGAMEHTGTLYDAWEQAIELNMRGMNRAQRRAYRAAHPNPHAKGKPLN